MPPSLAGSTRRILGTARRRARSLFGRGRDDPAILMYHRIASPPFDPWGLCVSPERFREQLLALKAHRQVMAMDDLVAALDAGQVPPRAVALTFDDGYSDNSTMAKPWLEELRCPATVFVASAFIGAGAPFWWDELAALVLGATGAAEIACEVAGARLEARWGARAPASDLAQWRVHHGTTDPQRLAYLSLWRALQVMGSSGRDRAMAELRRQLADVEGPYADAAARPMTAEQLRALRSPTIGLGGHGRTHAPLPKLSPGEREREIAGGRDELAALAGGEAPQGFAYPHGEWDAATRDAVIGAGYRWAVTTRDATIEDRRHDKFALPRIKVTDLTGPGVLRAMQTGIST